MGRLTRRHESGEFYLPRRYKDENGNNIVPSNQDAINKLAHYEDLEEQGYITQVANMLGVKLYEEFKIKPTDLGKVCGVKDDEKIYRFDSELVYKGHHDGWSEWYGFGCDKVLYHLLLGKLEIVKLKELEG